LWHKRQARDLHPTLSELIGLLEEAESVPVKRGSYKKTRAVKREAEISD
jgi:hypothetical protein